MIQRFGNKTPVLGEGCYVSESAAVIGDVELGADASVWFGASVRGDSAPIRVGSRTNIQDNATIHCTDGMPAVLGDRVSVGHNAVVHSAVVEDDALVGMGAVVLDGAVIGRGSIVAAGAVVTKGTQIPPYSLVMGIPGRIAGTVPEGANLENAEIYAARKEAYRLADTGRRRDPLDGDFAFRGILPGEKEQAAAIEEICFPPNEACSREQMDLRADLAPELFLVAEDRKTGRLAGFLNGIATKESAFRDEFFMDASLHDPAGDTVMLCGLDVLPACRGRGLARELIRRYARRERERGRRRLVLTCHAEKTAMYEKMGFRDLGLSASVWGGESWHEMDLLL